MKFIEILKDKIWPQNEEILKNQFLEKWHPLELFYQNPEINFSSEEDELQWR